MADIAMLVAEEYERRVKSSRKGGNGDGEGSSLFGVSWVSASSFVYELAEKAKIKMMGEEKNYLEHARWVLEPKSQLGLAASNGFFSA